MGLFSGDVIVSTGASITPLITDKPNLVREAIIRASINDWDITNTLIDALLNGSNLDYEAYNQLGKDLPGGLPYFNLEKNRLDFDLVRARIADEHSVGDSQIYLISTNYRYPAMNSDELVAYYMSTKSSSRNAFSGYYSNVSFAPSNHKVEVLRTDTVSEYPDPQAPPDITTVIVYISFTGTSPTGSEEEQTHEFDPEVFAPFAPYQKIITASYRVGAPDYPRPLMYYFFELNDESTDGDPLKQAIFDSFITDLFPAVPIKSGGNFTGEDPNDSPEEQAIEVARTDKLLNKLGMTTNDLIDSLKTNEDYENVSSGYVTLGVPLSKNIFLDDATSEYLFRHMVQLDIDSPNGRQEFEDSLTNTGGRYPNRSGGVFNQQYTNYKFIMQWDYVEITSTTYNASKAGKYVFGYYVNDEDVNTTSRELNTVNDSYIYVDFHDSSTGTATRALMKDVLMSHAFYANKEVIFGMKDVFGPDNDGTKEGMYLPMSLSVLRSMGTARADSAAYSSLILVNQAVVRTTLDWYQSEAFLSIVFVAVIVVSVITMQPGMVAAYEAGATALALYVLESVALGYIYSAALGYVFTFIIKAIGGDAAVILAVLAVVAAAAVGLEIEFPFAMPTASDILKVVNIWTEALEDYTAGLAEDFLKETSEYYEALTEALYELAEINDGLGDVGIDASLFEVYGTEVNMYASETSDGFLTRSLLANPGVMIYDSLNYFYDGKLSLPSVNDIDLSAS